MYLGYRYLLMRHIFSTFVCKYTLKRHLLTSLAAPKTSSESISGKPLRKRQCGNVAKQTHVGRTRPIAASDLCRNNDFSQCNVRQY